VFREAIVFIIIVNKIKKRLTAKSIYFTIRAPSINLLSRIVLKELSSMKR
jgi:hypothetical protein